MKILKTNQKFFLLLLSLITAAMLFSCKEKSGQSGELALVDRPAPEFQLTDTNGTLWSLADLRGKVVFLNFWATWCPPCREELPSMNALNLSLDPEKFQMLTVLENDDPLMAERLLDKMGIRLPILIDPGETTARAYGLTGVPESFIIDPQGIVRNKMIGARAWDSPVAKQMIEDLM